MSRFAGIVPIVPVVTPKNVPVIKIRSKGSRSMTYIIREKNTGPYAVELEGVDSDHNGVYLIAKEVNGTYLTLYTKDIISIKNINEWTATYKQAIDAARDLIEDGENVEYTRGICELIGDTWGIDGVLLVDRKDMIAAEIGVQSR